MKKYISLFFIILFFSLNVVSVCCTNSALGFEDATLEPTRAYPADPGDQSHSGPFLFDAAVIPSLDYISEDKSHRAPVGFNMNLASDKVMMTSTVKIGKTDNEYAVKLPNGAISPSDLWLGYNDGNSNEALILNFNTGLGYQFEFIEKRFTVTPLLGLLYQKKTNKILTRDMDDNAPHLSMTLSDDDFEEVMEGLWLGLDMNFFVLRHLKIISSLEYYAASYESSTSETAGNKINTSRFYQSAEKEGVVWTFGVQHHFSENLHADIIYSWQEWLTEAGTDYLNESADTGKTTHVVMPETNQAVNLSLSYEF